MIRLSELAAASGAKVLGEPGRDALSGIAYDSRADCGGRLFVAIRGEGADGHDFIAQAVAKGAGAVLCERPPASLALGVPCLVVLDVLVALADWARATVAAWSSRVVAVTGSLGKTTTKELLSAILSRRFRVSPSPGNLSGRLGLPVALAEMDAGPEVVVLEFASDSFGEMRAMAGMAPPELLLVTNVREPHQDAFNSLDNAAAEMATLVEALAPAGLAVLNRDDERTLAMRSRAPSHITFGGSAADVSASHVRLDEQGLEFLVHAGGETARCRVRLYSPGLVSDCLAAIAGGLALGVALDEAVVALADCAPLPGRLNPLAGRRGTVVLDDTFSACPSSCLVALEGLRAFPAGRRHAVLAGLDDTAGFPGWAEALSLAAARSADVTWALGDCAAEVARHLPRDAEARVFYSLGQLEEALLADLRPGDVVLVKGNRTSRLERLVGKLAQGVAPPLVRQEAYWETLRLVRPERPTWIEIDAEALAGNARRFRQVCGVPLMAVLKADAYGHGAARVARIALANGAEGIGVACLSEARALREAGIGAEILVLGYTPRWQARQAVRLGVTCTVFGEEEAQALSHAAEALRSTAKVQVKVDTGMARLGLAPADVLPFARELRRLPRIDVTGIFTHFGSADDVNQGYARLQLDRFLDVLAQLEREGLRPRLAHAANTAAALMLPEARLDMVRIGIGLYGLPPSPHVALPAGVREVLSLKTTVAQVKQVSAGSFVGYGQAHCPVSPLVIAVIPVGYADGFRRAPRNWGKVLVRGQRCPLVGDVCMDQAMVDVSSLPGVRKGDEVVLIGRQGDANIGADEVAERLGTINYEVVSQSLARVPRIT